MRTDRRRPDQMRPVRITPNFISSAEGSALIEVGRTRVICTASIEPTVPAWLRGSGKGWVTSEYGMLPRSTSTRTAREATRGRISGRTHEIQRLIGRSLRAVTPLETLGERSIILDCDVIEADGGTRCAAVTGSFVALFLAFHALVRSGDLKAIPLRDYVAAVSAGVVEGTPLLDLSYEEDSSAQVDMNLVMTGRGQFIEVQATGERATFDDAQLEAMKSLARQGIAELVAAQKAVLPALL
jgi:ribonuclease PH